MLICPRLYSHEQTYQKYKCWWIRSYGRFQLGLTIYQNYNRWCNQGNQVYQKKETMDLVKVWLKSMEFNFHGNIYEQMKINLLKR